MPDSVDAAGVGRLALSDVRADLNGLDHGAGIVLWIKTGRLASLEGFSFDEPWPERVEAFQVVGEHASGNAPTDLELVEAEHNRR